MALFFSTDHTAAISLLMDYSVEAAVEIQRELGVSTEEGFNSMLDRDRMLDAVEVEEMKKMKVW